MEHCWLFIEMRGYPNDYKDNMSGKVTKLIKDEGTLADSYSNYHGHIWRFYIETSKKDVFCGNVKSIAEGHRVDFSFRKA